VTINQSLFVLRRVITALSKNAKQDGSGGEAMGHVPYRESKLTSLLQQAIGGNGFMLMLACLSPADKHYEENLSTLQYATQAASIKNQPMLNLDPKDRLILRLREQLAAAHAYILQVTGLEELPPELGALEVRRSRDRAQGKRSSANRRAVSCSALASSSSNLMHRGDAGSTAAYGEPRPRREEKKAHSTRKITSALPSEVQKEGFDLFAAVDAALGYAPSASPAPAAQHSTSSRAPALGALRGSSESLDPNPRWPFRSPPLPPQMPKPQSGDEKNWPAETSVGRRRPPSLPPETPDNHSAMQALPPIASVYSALQPLANQRPANSLGMYHVAPPGPPPRSSSTGGKKDREKRRSERDASRSSPSRSCDTRSTTGNSSAFLREKGAADAASAEAACLPQHRGSLGGSLRTASLGTSTTVTSAAPSSVSSVNTATDLEDQKCSSLPLEEDLRRSNISLEERLRASELRRHELEADLANRLGEVAEARLRDRGGLGGGQHREGGTEKEVPDASRLRGENEELKKEKRDLAERLEVFQRALELESGGDAVGGEEGGVTEASLGELGERTAKFHSNLVVEAVALRKEVAGLKKKKWVLKAMIAQGAESEKKAFDQELAELRQGIGSQEKDRER